MILIPVVILGIVAVLSNIMAVVSIRNVNKTATVISDNYLTGVQCLSDVEAHTKEIHNKALSHIIATDFETMIGLVGTIEELESELEVSLTEYSKYVDESDSNYTQLKDNYGNFKLSVRKLMAYSANQDSVAAYACANGEVSDYAAAMGANLDALKEAINTGSVDARQALSGAYNFAVVTDVILIIVSAVSVIAAIYIVFIFVIKPLVRAEREIKDIISGIDAGEGDLTKRITITSNDEIAALGNGINAFMSKLQDIFSMITNNSGKMEIVVSEVLGSVRTSNESASDLSAVTEELSATMQEVANSAGVINKNTASVNEEVNNIAEKSNELNEYSKNMKQHADYVQEAVGQTGKTERQVFADRHPK